MRNLLRRVLLPPRLLCLLGLVVFVMNTAHAQSHKNFPALALIGYQAFALRVSDIEQSVRFYSDVFGTAPVLDAKRATYPVGQGNRHFVLFEAEEGEPLGFAWIGLGIRDYDKDAVGDVLTQLGFTRTAGLKQAPLDRAMRFWIDESWGQDALFFADAEGIVFRVMSI